MILHFFNSFYSSGDQEVTCVCGIVCSIHDKPIQYTSNPIDTTCDTCWQKAAKDSAKSELESYKKIWTKNFDSLVQARVLIQKFLEGNPLTDKSEEWVKKHWAYASKFTIDEFLK